MTKTDLLWEKSIGRHKIGFPVVDLDTFFNIFRTGDQIRVTIIDQKEEGQSGLFTQVIEWTRDGCTLRFHTWTVKELRLELNERNIQFPACSC